jgi:hypothetical protein
MRLIEFGHRPDRGEGGRILRRDIHKLASVRSLNPEKESAAPGEGFARHRGSLQELLVGRHRDVDTALNMLDRACRVRHLANARLAQSAHAALDASGRHLLAANQSGRVLWCTPQADKLLRAAFSRFDSETFILPADVRNWLQAAGSEKASAASDLIPLQDTPERKLRLSYVGKVGADEILLRLIDEEASREEIVLKSKLSLTLREAEVLTWIARGKSNRDIGEILGLSRAP